MFFSRYERFILWFLASIAITDGVLIAVNHVGLDWSSYAFSGMIASFFIIPGAFYRYLGRDDRLASMLVATGISLLFGQIGAVFNYLLLPVHFPRIDYVWVAVDRMLGYDWVALVTYVSQWPWFCALLRMIYFSCLPQLALIILVLGFAGNEARLAQFLLTSMFGALLCIGIWAMFPSFGASSVFALPDAVQNVVKVAVSPAYGAELVHLSQTGVDYITPKEVRGLIGFPSYHTVMGLMSVAFIWSNRWLRIPFLCVNLLMIPALLIHGGHHLSDFFGGIACFAAAYAAAGWVVSALRADRVASAPAALAPAAP